MTCEQKRQLLTDYLERIQALAVQAELLLESVERNSEDEPSREWLRMEKARISCDIARLALGDHTSSHGC